MHFDSLAFAGSPVQWAILIVIVLVVFAPKTLPMLVRRFGGLFMFSALRKIGLPIQPPARAIRPPKHEMKVVESASGVKPREEIRPTNLQSQSKTSRPLWIAGILVIAVAAVLSWYLFRER